tara:strand:+ start:728 stop:922 length:195 start_codon:yes stop_codon:yes gene_type:complete
VSEDEFAARLRVLERDNALLTQEVRQLHEKIDSITGGVGRGLWILGGGFIASFVAWIVSGGLSR